MLQPGGLGNVLALGQLVELGRLDFFCGGTKLIGDGSGPDLGSHHGADRVLPRGSACRDTAPTTARPTFGQNVMNRPPETHGATNRVVSNVSAVRLEAD